MNDISKNDAGPETTLASVVIPVEHNAGNIPNPKAESAVISLHRNLACYMGIGEPQPLD